MQTAAAFWARVLGVRWMLLSSLHGYRWSWVIGDLVAGLTLLAIAVPEQLATARLAGMPPITGFYAFVAGGSTDHASEVPGVLVVMFATPLWYANAAHFRSEMTAAINRAGHTLRLVGSHARQAPRGGRSIG